MKKDIEGMSREELVKLISSMINEREFGISPINKVSVCDLIKTNKKFITLRQNKIKADNLGYFG